MYQPNAEAKIGPVRTCVGCRQRHQVDQLIRIGCDESGQLVWKKTVPGRGVWLCRESPECVERALKSKAFVRGLRCTISSDALAVFVAAFAPEVQQ